MPTMQPSTSPHPTPANDVNPAVIECKSPITGERFAELPVDDARAVQAAIARARVAQEAYGQSSFADRRKVLRAILDAVVSNADAICDAVVRDSGKTRENAMLGEVMPICEKLRWTIKRGEAVLRPQRVSSGMLVHKRAQIEYLPAGVAGAILPWNYPFQNLLNPIITALMAGDAIVIKPSEWVSWSSARFHTLVREAIQKAGQSPELVQVVHGYAETAQALIAGGVDVLLFIGSVPNGRRVLRAAAETLTPVVLELGGKDPLIVCDDADMERAVHAALGGTFINCGQNCVASERILVHASKMAWFEGRIASHVNAMRQGASENGLVDVGAMITPLQLAHVEGLVARAVAEGARIVTGGKRQPGTHGWYYEPTVLSDLRPDMEIMREEMFGPVMLLCAFNSDEEAIEIANNTAFGLSSSVFSRDGARAKRIADRVHAGMAAINDFGGMTYMAQELPFGGVKDSGFGRMNGAEGLRASAPARACWWIASPSASRPRSSQPPRPTTTPRATPCACSTARRWASEPRRCATSSRNRAEAAPSSSKTFGDSP
ncbi:MAG: aldehyde dehydrogenase family protein [Sandaracinaceae bacterium]|nr:aldehyde dehydrogenase family protein [Sandaracinaceae bacterium]